MNTITVTNDRGDQFTALLVPPGDEYPVHSDESPIRNQSTKHVLAFYDAEYSFTQYGQFTGAYYNVSTLLARYYVDEYQGGYSWDWHKVAGLNLHCGVPKWQIDADAYRLVLQWAVHELEAQHYMGTGWLPTEKDLQWV